jgi:hypothetical protein
MEVSGQLHAPATLFPERQLMAPTGKELLGTKPVWTTLWRREYILF